jgi:2-keto-4-pentenoate hydratase/2-oxohepta-3-ene-1,7-dioic acid hydratase in catechol pathway
MKPITSVIVPGQTIYRPLEHQGRVIFEAELGIVFGSNCQEMSEEIAVQYIFSYTCVNDVTAIEFLFEDKAFQHWTRCNGFDMFTPLGPWITTGINPSGHQVMALQGDKVRQDYPVRDMIFSPMKIVSLMSHYQTLLPGVLICCGRSVGARTMKPGSSIDIVIPGIGKLSNQFEDLSR